MSSGTAEPRTAALTEEGSVARLLDAFNREFAAPSPGVQVLEARLRRLLPSGTLVALLAGGPADGVAVVALRPSVWHDGPVGLLEELYVLPGSRNRGTGAALLRAAEEVVRGRGGGTLEIDVDGGDLDARRFSERHGYLDRDPGREDQLLYDFRELPPVGQR
jgi:GNAT superfamily N-acetyltransferase